MSVSKKGKVWLVRTQIRGRDIRRTAPTRQAAEELDAALRVSRFYEVNDLTRERFVPKRISRQSWIYFIQADDGPIKIGITTNDPPERLRLLQTAHHAELRLLGVCPGSRRTEREMHEYLAAHRLQGEWFKPTPEVLDLVDEYAEPWEDEEVA